MKYYWVIWVIFLWCITNNAQAGDPIDMGGTPPIFKKPPNVNAVPKAAPSVNPLNNERAGELQRVFNGHTGSGLNSAFAPPDDWWEKKPIHRPSPNESK
jgi:hypothetical protein